MTRCARSRGLCGRMAKIIPVYLFIVLAAQCPTPSQSVEEYSEGCLQGFSFRGTKPTDSYQCIPTGEVIFADLRFQCSGRLRRITMMLVFDAKSTYNTSLQCNLTLWQANGGHYRRSGEVVLPLLSYESLNLSFEESATVTIIRQCFDIDVPVKAGYLLGLSLPPPSASVHVLNHIPLAGEHDTKSPLIQLTGNCFSPEQGWFPCPSVVQSIRPAIQVDFVHDGNVNSGAASGMESCHCLELKIALISVCLFTVLALVGAMGAVGAAVGCLKCCRKGKRHRSGGMHARCMNEVGYHNGNYTLLNDEQQENTPISAANLTQVTERLTVERQSEATPLVPQTSRYNRLLREASAVPKTSAAVQHQLKRTGYQVLDDGMQYMNVRTSTDLHGWLVVPSPDERELIEARGSVYDEEVLYDSVRPIQSKYWHLSTAASQGRFWSPGATENEIYGQMSQNKYQELPRSSVHLGEALGEGEFGDVYRGEWQSTMGCVEVAVKVSKDCLEPDERVKLLQEAAVMGQFLHPRVVRLFGVVTLGEPCMVVLELLPNGDLQNHLIDLAESLCSSPKDPGLPKKLLQFCLEIADGMSYLSKKGFIHRDLAARNILLDKDWRCKIADFGLSRDLAENPYYGMKGGRVPLRWTAPEAVLYNKFCAMSDVWSFGILMYEIWSLGCRPFHQATTVKEVVQVLKTVGYCMVPPPGCPRGIYSLMVNCWNPDYHSRPSFDDLHKSLLGNPSLLLKWTEEDLSVSPQASMLGGPLEEGKGLYLDLQLKYEGRSEP